MTVYVYSTLAAPVTYVLWERSQNNTPVAKKKITIHGGAGVASNDTASGRIVTPRGVVTAVSDEDFGILKNDPVFSRQLERKFLSVEKKKVEVNKITADMNDADKSRPVTPASLKASAETAKVKEARLDTE